MSSPTLTSTSYAILGLLAVKPWTTHELVQQVDRSLRRIWPRTRASSTRSRRSWSPTASPGAEDASVGRRPRTRYTITAQGRRALAEWVREPGAGPSLEFEQLVKIHFADSDTKAAVLANLHATLAWVREENEENLATARAYLEQRGEFPERAALNQLTGQFLAAYYVCVAEWAEWAIGVVEEWPDDVTQAPFDLAVAEQAVRMVQSIAPAQSS